MVGLYVHVPFCASRCGYCDFTSQVYDAAAASRYLKALGEEAAAARATVGPQEADTLYFGGGTPTTLGAKDLTRLLGTVHRTFRPTADAEVTCEANPESATAAVLAALRRGGVNRLSLGVQSLDDRLLRAIGRRHDAAGAEAAARRARAAGFANVSLDLIYGLPAQTVEQWRGDLGRALALEPDHVSLYALTLEPHVPLARAGTPLPGDDALADMYYAAADELTTAGFVHYEISNFARPGRECRHNLKYWRDDDYLAFGPAAAAHWRGSRHKNPPALDAYCVAAGRGAWPLTEVEPSDPAREMRTAMVLGLRLLAGVDAPAFRARFGVDPREHYAAELRDLAAAGLVEVAGDTVRLSRRGLFLSDEVFARLI